jgi:hypothetical protein
MAGDAGQGHVKPSALTETALARMFKQAKGFKRNYTLRMETA